MKTIVVHQWNVLADCFADQLGFPYVSQKVLDWEHRKELFKKILADPGDGIYVLEEVELHMLKFFSKHIFTEHFTEWVSKNSTDGSMRDGTAIFYPHKLFSVVEKYDVALGTQNALFLHFKEPDFWLCAVHLKAKDEGAAVRPQQIKKVLSFLADLDNVVLVGDFNDVPESETIARVLEAGFESAYPEFEPTTAKVRLWKIVRCIDYIWYRGAAFAGVAERGELSESPPMLPNEEWPSDHFKLCAKIKLN
jgi:mRNA deadenylase 3'-5' endonuclease subunit Ccr4